MPNDQDDVELKHTKSFFSGNPYSKRVYKSWTVDDICNNVYYLIDNNYIRFGGTVFHQTIGIPMGTNCAPLLADFILVHIQI
jgi:hypothetical protein